MNLEHKDFNEKPVNQVNSNIDFKEDLRSLLNAVYLAKENFPVGNKKFKNIPVEKGHYFYKVILFKNFMDGVTVYDSYAAEGTISKEDSHPVNNLIFVYKGKVDFYIKDDIENRYEKYELTPGKILKINKHKIHYAEFAEDTFMIGVFYPPLYI